jgi:hypothetical protein
MITSAVFHTFGMYFVGLNLERIMCSQQMAKHKGTSHEIILQIVEMSHSYELGCICMKVKKNFKER